MANVSTVRATISVRPKPHFFANALRTTRFHLQQHAPTAPQIIRGIRAIRGLSPIRFNDSTVQRFNGGEAIRVHSCVFVVNIRRWLRLMTGE